jgi:iron complex transport system ATP-binding protein
VTLALKGVHVAYGDVAVLAGIDGEARPGTVTAIIGPNGSGKTTLIRALAGLVPWTGEIAIEGKSVAPAARVRPCPIGYLPQDLAQRAALTVLEVALLGRVQSLGFRVRAADLAAARQALADVGTLPLASRLIGELSGGQRQLVFLAQVLAGEPRLLLLDEPTSALDLRNQLEILGLVRRHTRSRQLTTVVAIHDLNAAARFADHVIVLARGRVHTAGPPADVICPQLLAEVYRVEADVRPAADGLPTVTPLRLAAQGVGA